MTDYTITTNFGAKDSLPSGNAAKVIKGSEFTTEFTNIATAVSSKADTAGDTFTGAVTFDAAVTNNAAVTVNSTATITGDLTVDTDTLFVDVSEDKVGIGTTSFISKFHVGGSMTDYLYSEPAGDSIATFAPITTGSSSAMNVNIGSGMYGGAGVETARLNFLNGHGNDGFATGFSIKSYKTASATATDGYLAFEEIRRAGNTGVTHKEQMRITSDGDVLVGTTDQTLYNNNASGANSNGTMITPSGEIQVAKYQETPLYVNRMGNNGTCISIRNRGVGVGAISTTSTATTYITSSDERLKENITDSADAGSKVDAIQIRQFDWKVDGSHQDYGVIAQELIEVAPEAVAEGDTEEDMMGVDYSKLVPMLIKEVQSLRSRVAELENV